MTAIRTFGPGCSARRWAWRSTTRMPAWSAAAWWSATSSTTTRPSGSAAAGHELSQHPRGCGRVLGERQPLVAPAAPPDGACSASTWASRSSVTGVSPCARHARELGGAGADHLAVAQQASYSRRRRARGAPAPRREREPRRHARRAARSTSTSAWGLRRPPAAAEDQALDRRAVEQRQSSAGRGTARCRRTRPRRRPSPATRPTAGRIKPANGLAQDAGAQRRQGCAMRVSADRTSSTDKLSDVHGSVQRLDRRERPQRRERGAPGRPAAGSRCRHRLGQLLRGVDGHDQPWTAAGSRWAPSVGRLAVAQHAQQAERPVASVAVGARLGRQPAAGEQLAARPVTVAGSPAGGRRCAPGGARTAPWPGRRRPPRSPGRHPGRGAGELEPRTVEGTRCGARTPATRPGAGQRRRLTVADVDQHASSTPGRQGAVERGWAGLRDQRRVILARAAAAPATTARRVARRYGVTRRRQVSRCSRRSATASPRHRQRARGRTRPGRPSSCSTTTTAAKAGSTPGRRRARVQRHHVGRRRPPRRRRPPAGGRSTSSAARSPRRARPARVPAGRSARLRGDRLVATTRGRRRGTPRRHGDGARP